MDYGRRPDPGDNYGNRGGGRERERPAERGGNRYNEYFLPGEGISREGRSGYLIKAYRNLTTEMISDLKADSARWEAERRQQLSQQDPRDPRRYPGKSVKDIFGYPSPDSPTALSYVNSATYDESPANMYERQQAAGTPQSFADSGYDSRRGYEDSPQLQSAAHYAQQQMQAPYNNYAPTSQTGYQPGIPAQYQYEPGRDGFNPRTHDFERGAPPPMPPGVNPGYPQQQGHFVTAPPGMHPQAAYVDARAPPPVTYADSRFESRHAHAPPARETHGRRHR
ncbi:MAG: hypothetical protein Q9227_002894 [Pyrenula ochraceoflavens]